MKVNVNDIVRVRLTDAGAIHLRKHCALYRCSPPEPESDGRYRFQLYGLMQIFGELHYNGSNKLPFVDNEIEIREWLDE